MNFLDNETNRKPAQLVCEGLSLGYENTLLLRDLSFTVREGDYLCIVGENGSGKSTLMRTLLHLQPPLAGRVTLEGGLKPNEIGYLPQQTDIQRDFPASVREIVLSGCQARLGRRPFYGQEEKKLAAESMEKLGVAPLAQRCYRELSGGQQQRVLLARALCATRKLLLLDEPVSGLDPKAAAEMYELIEGLNREGITIIMISHDMHYALRRASHILQIGRDWFYGSKADYLRSPVGRHYLRAGKEAER